MKIEIAGHDAFIVYFADKASAEISARIQAAVFNLREQMAEFLVDLVPSYASLLVIYDVNTCDHFEAKKRLTKALTNLDAGIKTSGDLVTLPVYYSTESGPDLNLIAEQANLSTEQVIDIHQQGEYRVYAIGFAPGFAYLGEVDQRIAAPRLATPRLKVPRGAVAIADRQTAVYPAPSPGGWNLIGLCPTRMFDPDQHPNQGPTMPVQVGDRVQFKAIDRDKFISLGGEV
jgi:KipI family sensor histidine kinase inhibitor